MQCLRGTTASAWLAVFAQTLRMVEILCVKGTIVYDPFVILGRQRLFVPGSPSGHARQASCVGKNEFTMK